jgi:N-acetylmuramoyl-L-alanine amidase
VRPTTAICIAALGIAGSGAFAFAQESERAEGPDRGLVVIDPGHGGADHGARGRAGVLEKDVVLAVSRKLATALEAEGYRVVLTREDDRFVSLPERTALANRSRAGLYLSIHANSSTDRAVRGAETYFLSLSASDDEARRVANTENRVFARPEASAGSGDVVGDILGDLIRTDHLRASSDMAGEIQRKLDALPGPGRGVKQAPFVVLMGVNMPAALLEIGFLTHPQEERNLASASYQAELAGAVASAVSAVRERHAGLAEPERRLTEPERRGQR